MNDKPILIVQDEVQQMISGNSGGGTYSASELMDLLIRAGRSEGITLPDRPGVLDQLEEGYYVYSPERFDDTPGAVVAAAYDSLKGREADVQDYRDERMVVVLREADVAELRGEEEYMWEQLSHHRASDFGVDTVTLVPDDECQPDFPG